MPCPCHPLRIQAESRRQRLSLRPLRCPLHRLARHWFPEQNMDVHGCPGRRNLSRSRWVCRSGHDERQPMERIRVQASNLLSSPRPKFCGCRDLSHAKALCALLRSPAFSHQGPSLSLDLHRLRLWLHCAPGLRRRHGCRGRHNQQVAH